MRRLAGIAAAIAIASAPAAAEPVRSVYMSPADYPDGVRPAWPGFRVRVRYELAGDGSVAGCDVTRSSGNPGIDAAACRILLERARIRPEPGAISGLLQFDWPGEAQPDIGNERGAPLQLGFVEAVSPNDYPLQAIRNHESGEARYDVDVSENGVPLGCTIARSSGSQALDRRTCELVMIRCVFIPASDGAGGRRRGVFHGRFRWRM